jgi:virulence-associated protein VapD
MLGFGASEAVSLWGGQNSDSAYEGDYLTDSNSDSSYTVSGDGELTSDSDGTKSSDETTTETGTIDADKIIYTGSLTLYADDFNATANSIKSYVQGLGGFIQSSTYYDSGNSASAYTASGTLVLRVPSDLFDDVMEQMATYGDVTNETTDSSNISQTYQDLEAELESYQIQEERLLTYLSEAESISDMMTIESQLTSVRTQINSLQTTLNNLDNQISYSTITVYLYEQESETIDSPFGSFFQDIKTAFAQSLNFLLDALAFLLLWIVRLAPFAAIAVGIAYLVRVIRRKRIAKTSAAVPQNAEKSDGEAQ